MADDAFSRAVEDGMRLSKRIYGTDGRSPDTAPPPFIAAMDRLTSAASNASNRFYSFLPESPMVYAVIDNPAIVDNPDIPSYQPYVYGKLDPPAMIPLQMMEVGLEVECFLDVAVVSLRGRWRVHCVTRSKRCDCRVVLPVGEQGSVLGVDVEIGRRSFSTRVIEPVEDCNIEKMAKGEAGGFLRPQLFSLIIPQINGGSDIWVSARWSQKLVYKGCEFSITIPFNFPDYVNPWVRHLAKKQKIQLHVNTGTGNELLLQKKSHPFKEKDRQAGKLSLLYEADVERWSTADFHVSCQLQSSNLFGGVIIQSPTMNDDDRRDMFCLYLFPGNDENMKVFKKEVVFVVDISGSMQGKPLENVKNALSTALLELKPEDYFGIIGFNDELHCFASHLQPATSDMIEDANQWINENLIAGGGTEIMKPLNEALSLLSSTQDSIPHIFLVTDGSVEDERNICSSIRTSLTNQGSISPRISTFGIGTYCNHYFLKMLASVGRGQYDASYDQDSIETRMLGWLHRASSPIVANINVDIFNSPDDFEVHPFPIPDLSGGCPLFVTGRLEGKFPGLIKAKGILADMSDMSIDLKVETTKEFPIDKIFAKQRIDHLTTEAWFSESKQLQEKVTKLSILSSIQSEYTALALLLTETEMGVKQSKSDYVKMHASPKERRPSLIRGMILGFGDAAATIENLPAGFAGKKLPNTDTYGTRTVGCSDCCCCFLCLRACSKMSDQCGIVLTQLCAVLSCFACSECYTLCCDHSDH